MRRARALRVLALLMPLAACAVPTVHPAVEEPAEARRHEIEDRGFDALHYRIALNIPGDSARFDGAVDLILLSKRQLDRVVLDAADMTITSAQADGVAAKFRHTGPRLVIELPAPLPAGRSTTVRVEYHVENPLGGAHFSLPQELGTQHVPQVFTQGEDERARFWLPCVDSPHERATHEISLTVPLSWETIAAGRQVERETHPETSTATAHWTMEQPMPAYLFTFAAGPFVRVEDRWEDVTITHYVEPQDADAARASFASTPDVLGFFSDYTGFRYPYSKYAHVAVRDFPFGGMENVSATTVTRGALHSAAEQAVHPTWGLVAHEAAHQWFGDLVTSATWPHIWLNEGFATYFGNLYQRHAEGEDAFLYGYGRTLDGYLNACRGENLRALVKHEYRLPMDLFFDGTVYPGGASRLHLLNGMLGEEQFRAGILLYLQRNQFQSVTTDAFEAAMSQAARRDLGPWFKQWVYAPGYPELEVSWRLDAYGDAKVELKQVQSGRGTPEVFNFLLEVQWWEGTGMHVQKVEVDERTESWTFDLGEDFTGFLEFDSSAWIPASWSVHETGASTRARAMYAGSPRVRALACRDLAAAGDAAAVGVLWEVAKRDALPALRAESVGLLDRFVGAEDVAQLVAAWRAESVPSVRSAWWRSICRFGEVKAAHDRMSEVLYSKSALAQDRAAALRGVAAAAEELARVSLLRSFAKDVEAPETVRLAAIRQLAASFPGAETRGFLLPMTWKGNDTTLRAAALGALEPWLAEDPKQDPAVASVVDSYRIALLSPSAVLRRTAAKGAGLYPQHFGPQIRELMEREPDTRIRRLLEGVR
ncbi:MAG: M1 family metallopeptidase [Planctomycetota bacterium]|nr:M1 family metallopeptidase [Planctomycetota bacterium]